LTLLSFKISFLCLYIYDTHRDLSSKIFALDDNYTKTLTIRNKEQTRRYPTKSLGGIVYRINKKSGELHKIEGKGMYPVLDFRELDKRVSYYIDWTVTSMIVGVFVCANAFTWITIRKKRNNVPPLP